MKHSNVFYKFREGQFEAVKGARAVRNKADLDLFRIDDNIYEGKTGYLIKSHLSRRDMLETVAKLETDETLRKRAEDSIAKIIDGGGLSPRYTRPDEKYADLFPQMEYAGPKTVLALSLSGVKHYYIEDAIINGVTIYALKSKQRDPLRDLYVHYEGWMLKVGDVFDLQSLTRLLQNGVPNFRQIMTESLDKALAMPDRWADIGFARFLDRIEEATTHNWSIQEVWRARRDAEHLERERREEEKRLDEQREYENALCDGEQAILHKRELTDDKAVRGSLVLQLFRQNDVDVPLKTQGWIKAALYQIYHDEQNGKWDYVYYRDHKPSQAFYGCLNELVSAVEHKYEQTPDTDDPIVPEDGLEL